MSCYFVYESDLRKAVFRLVLRRVNRAACEKLARELNAKALAGVTHEPDRAADGLPVPLYYVLRSGAGDTPL